MSQSALILSILGDVSGIQVSKLTQFESGLGKFLSDNFIDGWLYYSKGNYFLPWSLGYKSPVEFRQSLLWKFVQKSVANPMSYLRL